MNREGQLAVQSVLKDARRIARSLAPDKRAAIEQLCNEIDELAKELAELQARGEVCMCVCMWMELQARGEVRMYMCMSLWVELQARGEVCICVCMWVEL